MKLAMYLVLSTHLLAQNNLPITQQGGDCAVNTSGTNNTVSLVCKGLDPKVAEQISKLLKLTRQNVDATKEFSDKLDQILNQMNKETVAPVVGLRFVDPKFPALVVVNQSDAIARNIKWAVELWNMDLPDRMDPLPIPTSTFDWVRPHDEGGPEDLFSPPAVASLLKPGNRLLGSASVICPECKRGRTYIVYIVWGQGGWVYEVENEHSGKAYIPRNFLKEPREKYFKDLEAAVPVESRTPIGEF